MADDPESPGRPQQNRRETQSLFGRNAVVRSKPRGQIFWSIGVIAALAVIVAVMVQFGPTPSTKRSFLRDWLAERRQVQRQRDMEENLQHVQQVKRQSEALQQKSKVESEAAWSEFNKRMQSPQQTAPQETQTEERLASLKNDGSSAAPEDKQSLAAHHDAVVWLSLSPDGSQLLSASTDKSIKLWDVKTGLLAKDVGRHGDMVRSALFLPGGDKVLSGADDGLIDIWSVGEGRLENTLVAREYGGVRGLAVSADGTLAVSSHESGTVVVWNLKERRKLHVLNGHQWPANAVAISPDGKLVVSGDIDGVIRTWDIQTGKSLRLWKGHERGIYGAAFLPDGKQAVTASGDGMLKLWNVNTGREVRSFPGHAGTVYAVSVSADGKEMLSGSLDATARLWDLATGEELAFFDNSGSRIYSVALLGDGSVAIGDETGTIKIYCWQGRRYADPCGKGRPIAASFRDRPKRSVSCAGMD